MSGSRPVLETMIVGCGRVGGGDGELSHAAAYSNHDGFRLAACVDPDEARRNAFMTRWDVPRGYRSIEQAIRDGAAWRVASVCTPTPQHAADLRALLATDVQAVWCEKPLTGSHEESEEIGAAYARAGKYLAVNHVRRWHPAMERLQAGLAAGEWGAVRAITGFYTKGLRNNGSHMIDLVQFLVGSLEPRMAVVSGSGHDLRDPTVDAILTAENGAMVHLVGGNADDYAMFELEIVASLGTVRVEQSGRAIRARKVIDDPDSVGYRILDGGELETVGTGDVFRRAAANLYDAVVSDVPLASSAATAMSAECVCDALSQMAGEP